MIMALAGNKCDMEDSREVEREEAEAYAEELENKLYDIAQDEMKGQNT